MKIFFVLSITIIFNAFCRQVNAADVTGTLQIQLTVTSLCTLTPSTLNFGEYTGVPITDKTATLQVQCTESQPYDVFLDAGQHATGGDVTTRSLLHTGGVGLIPYQLYTDSARTEIWQSSGATGIFHGTGTGSVQDVTVYGSFTPTFFPPVGGFTDTVTVTVNW